jgi:LAS superfamily LD-carboxypeptidase LdcB
MAWHFRDAFSGDKLFITSAYRSKWFQNYLIKQWCVLLKCAPIGTSEHQAWLALDLKVITRWGRWYSLDAAYPNKYSDWLHVHARERGFHNTYQKGVAIDGKIVEWRHRRYLWITLAKILADNGQTLAEYYNTIIQWNN